MRKLFAATVIASLGLSLFGQSAVARANLPGQSHAFGKSRAAWLRVDGQWVLGSASNPLVTGECGEVIEGVFFMVTTIDVGVEVDCDIPAGAPIVFSHAAFYAWQPEDGATDEEIDALSREAFAPDSSTVVLDGRDVPQVTVSTGAYDVIAEPGSAYDVFFGKSGTVRTAVTGNLTVLRPLTPGHHEIIAAVDFTTVGGGLFDIAYHIDVG